MPNAVIIAGGFPSMSQTFVLREIESMKQKGWGVHVIAPHPGCEQEWIQAASFGIGRDNVSFENWRLSPICFRSLVASDRIREAAEFGTYGRMLGLRRTSFFKRISEIAGYHGCDLVHCHFVQWAREIGIGLSHILRIPLTVVAHDSFLESHSATTLQLVQERANAIACVCERWMGAWQEKTSRSERLVYVPNGVVISEFTSGPNSRFSQRCLSQKPITIVSVASCVRHKRPADLVKPIVTVRARGIDVRCLFVGGGPFEDELRELVTAYRLEKFVHVYGAQPHSMVRQMLSKCDMFALCSERESFGVVLTEAMAAGVPVIASRTAGAQEVVDDGGTGLLYEIGDIEALAGHIETLAKDPAMREQMGTAGQERAAARFSWDRHMALMEDLWMEAIEEGYRAHEC